MLTGLLGPSYTVPPPRIRGGDVLYVDFDGLRSVQTVAFRGFGND